METVDIIKVDAKQAETSIKQLRAQLKAYKDEMAGLEEGSSAFLTVAAKAGAVKHQMDEINESVRGASADIGDMLSTVTQIGAGVSAAFAGAVGVMQLMGVESEETTKAIQKLQALMTIPAGLLGLDAAIKGLKRLKSAFEASTEYVQAFQDAQKKAFSKAIYGSLFKELSQEYPQYLASFGKDLSQIVKAYGIEIDSPLKIDPNFKPDPEEFKDFTDKLKVGLEEVKSKIDDFNVSGLTKLKVGLKALGQQIKTIIAEFGPLALVLSTIALTITAIVKSFQAWKANSDSFLDKTIRQFEQLKATTSIFSKDFENYTKLFDRLANNQKYINSVEKQILAIDNLNNSYKEYIKNQQAVIELERQESLQKSLFTGNVEAARRGLNTIINSLYEGKNAGWFAKLFKQQLGDIRGLFKGSTLSELSNFNFASLIGLSDDQLKQTATDLNTQLNKLLEEVAPYIEGVQTQLTLITGDSKQDKARKAQL